MADVKNLHRSSTLGLGYDKTFDNGFHISDHSGNWATFTSDQSTTSYSTTKSALMSDEEAVKAFLKTTYNPFRESGISGTPTALDTGHPFSTIRRECIAPSHVFTYIGPYGAVWQGPLVPTAPGVDFSYPLVPVMSQNDIDRMGAKAIALTTPTAPEAQLSTALGELVLDELPHIPFLDSKLKPVIHTSTVNRVSRNGFSDGAAVGDELFTKTGGEFLNVAFGWAPLISDTIKYLKAVSNSYAIISQYLKDGQRGLSVRRAHKFEPTFSATVDVLSNNGRYLGVTEESNFHMYGGVDHGTLTQTDTVKQQYWFSGRYTYFADIRNNGIIDKLAQYAQRADKLLGLKLTPEVLWELSPWSWLVDWKLNIGDFLTNATRFSQDGLVLQYGYLMRRTDAIRTYSLTGPEFFSGHPTSSSVIFRVTRKERAKAFPYGFGVNPSDYTDQQWSILTALGLTKAAKVMRVY